MLALDIGRLYLEICEYPGSFVALYVLTNGMKP